MEAALKAAQTRFRPVIMTALSTIVGIIPIAFAFGTGGEARAPLGVAVAGGMAFGTFLTLFLVPVVYLGFARLEGRLGWVGAGVAANSGAGSSQPVQTGAS